MRILAASVMLHPKTDEVRKSMFETLCHTLIGLAIVIGATMLAIRGLLDSAGWAGACATAIAASGAVTILRRSDVDRASQQEPRPMVVVDRRGDPGATG